MYTARRLSSWLLELGAPGHGSELERAEAAFVRHVGDRRAWEALDAARLLAGVEVGLPVVIGEVRRRNLVRWDACSSIWEGERLGGGRGLIRVLRVEAARDPVVRRAISAEMSAIRALLPELRAATLGTVVAWVLPVASTAAEWPQLPFRLQLGWVFALEAWAAHGVLPWRPALPELVLDADGSPILAVLGVGRSGGFADLVRHVARVVGRIPSEGEPPALLRSLADAPPGSPDELNAFAVGELRDELTGAWHALRRRSEAVRLQEQVVRLHGLVQRLEAVPFPHADGAVGVDGDGEVVRVRADDAGIRWGQPERWVFRADGGFDRGHARALLRQLAAATVVRSALGEPGDGVDALARWVSSRFAIPQVVRAH